MAALLPEPEKRSEQGIRAGGDSEPLGQARSAFTTSRAVQARQEAGRVGGTSGKPGESRAEILGEGGAWTGWIGTAEAADGQAQADHGAAPGQIEGRRAYRSWTCRVGVSWSGQRTVSRLPSALRTTVVPRSTTFLIRIEELGVTGTMIDTSSLRCSRPSRPMPLDSPKVAGEPVLTRNLQLWGVSVFRPGFSGTGETWTETLEQTAGWINAVLGVRRI